MKHNIRINGEVKEVDCQLGSGILDKNGREIFEGDKVKTYFYDDDGFLIISPVTFEHGVCWCDDTSLTNLNNKALEIVDD